MFLMEAYKQEFHGDNDLILHRFLVECPNKTCNRGRHVINWEKNTSLPSTVTLTMFQQWHHSDKASIHSETQPQNV